MANTNFSLQPEGYNIEEVDRYIEMLRDEYQNAVSWGEELETKLERIENSMKEAGLYVAVEGDNQDEVITQLFHQLTETVNSKNRRPRSRRARSSPPQTKRAAPLCARR